MRKSFLLAAAVAALVAGCSGASSAADIGISLRITVWPRGNDFPEYRWTLRCNPLGGTLPFSDRACYFLATASKPFAPVPKDVACTEIYGGPAVALVRGVYRGQRVWARFNRTNGCQIDRWERLKYLFAPPRARPN